MKAAFFFLAVGATLAAPMPVGAQASGSLYDSRQGVIKGTSPGIVIIPARNPQAPAAAASSASAAAAATPASGTKASPPAAAGSAPAAPGAAAPFTWGEPPTGQPLSTARKLESPTIGIPIPVGGGAASQPAGKAPPKPGG